ncbi:hypothetical protein FQZ97_821600 [compost metagenome]
MSLGPRLTPEHPRLACWKHGDSRSVDPTPCTLEAHPAIDLSLQQAVKDLPKARRTLQTQPDSTL